MLADFDRFYTHIQNKIQTYSESQIPDNKLRVKVVMRQVHQEPPGCYVFLGNPQIQGEIQTPGVWQYKATYPLNCVAISKSEEPLESDVTSAARLRFAVQQILTVIFDQSDSDGGLEPGRILGLNVPSITPFSPDGSETPGVQGMRIDVEAIFGFEATLKTGTNLELLNVTSGDWSREFRYETKEESK